MNEINAGHIDEVLNRFKTDDLLMKEVRDKVMKDLGVHEAISRKRMSFEKISLASAKDAALTPQGQLVTESIVRPLMRPVLVIRENRVVEEFVGADSQVWASRIKAAEELLNRVIPAVGRVDVNNNPDFTWLGTGWLVANDIVVTNRHVADEFGRRGAAGFVFRAGVDGAGMMSSNVDFLEEYQRSATLKYAVKSILWIASPSDPDVAFLRVTQMPGDRPLPSPVPLTDTISDDDFVATIGYPARDSRIPDQSLVRKIFGDVFEKKRLAPGQLTGVTKNELQHDCSTLGGNSGSLVVSLSSGKAVGLHFAGLFMQSNFAVPAPAVRDLLARVQAGELPGVSTLDGAAPPAAPPSAPPPPDGPAATGAGACTCRLQIPVEVTVRVGGASCATTQIGPRAGGAATAADTGGGDLYAAALQAAREALAGDPDVLEVRLGYRFKRGWITDERVVVVELREKLSYKELRDAGKALIPPQFLGVGVDVRTASMADQLRNLGVESLDMLERRPKPGQYREPTGPQYALNPVREKMSAIFHVSPDSGFPNLKKFFGRVEKEVTATMYEWGADHISEAIFDAIEPDGRTLTMVTQRKTPAGGTEDAVDEMLKKLGEDKFQHVWASVGSGALIPNAYHIKVAVRDGKEFWLSSGNWKDSGQPDIDPAGENSTDPAPLRKHNREWHAIIENSTLATLFKNYIDFDFSEAQRVPLEEAVEHAWPDVFVPEEAFAIAAERAAVPVKYFDPLTIERELEVQPLLTPDRDAHHKRVFITFATAMISKATRSIYVENQSFNLLSGDDNVAEYEHFFEVLRDKQQQGVDVKVMFRDPREFPGGGAKLQKMLEQLKDFGFDTDKIRTRKGCHTKGIVVDSTEVLLGSENLTNDGSLFNRDASLLVRDAEVAEYFEQVFLFDWEFYGDQQADELAGGVRLAMPGEETPAGMRRMPLAKMLSDD